MKAVISEIVGAINRWDADIEIEVFPIVKYRVLIKENTLVVRSCATDLRHMSDDTIVATYDSETRKWNIVENVDPLYQHILNTTAAIIKDWQENQ